MSPKTGHFQRKVDKRKIFRWCYRHTNYGKVFGWIVAGSAVITFIMCLAGGGSHAFPGAGVLLILGFAALAVGGYYACRLLAAIHGYLTLKLYNEITHEFDETLPRPIEIGYRMVKYGYMTPAWTEVNRITRNTRMPYDDSKDTTYATFIGFQKEGVDRLDVQYLEKGVALPSVLKIIGGDDFRHDMIMAACRRMADDYEH